MAMSKYAKELMKQNTPTPATNTPTAIMSDSTKYAYTVHAQIVLGAQMVEDGLYQMAKGFKIMRDEKLYKELGYKSFEEYCEAETGISRMQVYNYIRIADKIPETDFVNSGLQNLGVKKLTLLAALDEEQRTEIIENTDLENTTVKDLQAKVKELTGRNNRLTEDINNWSEKFKAEKSKRETLLSENDRLGAEIKELRSRPVETVTIEKDPTETEAYQTLLLENDELISKNDELNFKIQDLEGELETARDNPDSIYNNPQAMQFEQLRDFFEDYYANANRAVRELYQFIKPDYPQDIRDYVRQRLGVLKQYINNLEELHEGEF